MAGFGDGFVQGFGLVEGVKTRRYERERTDRLDAMNRERHDAYMDDVRRVETERQQQQAMRELDGAFQLQLREKPDADLTQEGTINEVLGRLSPQTQGFLLGQLGFDLDEVRSGKLVDPAAPPAMRVVPDPVTGQARPAALVRNKQTGETAPVTERRTADPDDPVRLGKPLTWAALQGALGSAWEGSALAKLQAANDLAAATGGNGLAPAQPGPRPTAPGATPPIMPPQSAPPPPGAFTAAGQLQPGNIDLATRPTVQNPDGSVSTVRSMSINVDGREVLIPTVSDDGRVMSDEQAVAQFQQTGRHLGVFESPATATAYAQQLSQQQGAGLGPAAAPPSPALPAATPLPPASEVLPGPSAGPNASVLYVAHHFGAEGARKLLSSPPDTPAEQVLGEAAIVANPHLKGMTTGQLLAWAQQRYDNAPGSTYAEKINSAESSNNPNARNPRSSATGTGQFVEGTWLEQIRRHRPDLAAGRSDEELLALRTNPEVAAQLITGYGVENARALGLDPALAGAPSAPGAPATPGAPPTIRIAGAPDAAPLGLDALPMPPAASSPLDAVPRVTTAQAVGGLARGAGGGVRAVGQAAGAVAGEVGNAAGSVGREFMAGLRGEGPSPAVTGAGRQLKAPPPDAPLPKNTSELSAQHGDDPVIRQLFSPNALRTPEGQAAASAAVPALATPQQVTSAANMLANPPQRVGSAQRYAAIRAHKAGILDDASLQHFLQHGRMPSNNKVHVSDEGVIVVTPDGTVVSRTTFGDAMTPKDLADWQLKVVNIDKARVLTAAAQDDLMRKTYGHLATDFKTGKFREDLWGDVRNNIFVTTNTLGLNPYDQNTSVVLSRAAELQGGIEADDSWLPWRKAPDFNSYTPAVLAAGLGVEPRAVLEDIYKPVTAALREQLGGRAEPSDADLRTVALASVLAQRRYAANGQNMPLDRVARKLTEIAGQHPGGLSAGLAQIKAALAAEASANNLAAEQPQAAPGG